MSAMDGSALVAYQGARARCSATSAGSRPAVAYQMVARVWQVKGERGGGADRAGGAVAGLLGAEELPGVLERDLDSPSGRVLLDDLSGCGVQVRGNQGDVVAGLGAVADEDDLDRAGAKDRMPQAGDGGVHGGGFPVAGDGDRREGRR